MALISGAARSPVAVSAARLMFQAQQRRTETSRHKGVMWDPRRGRWAAVICKGKKAVQIAQFDDAEAAAIAYDRVALAWFGHDIERNFPQKRLRPASVEEMREWARQLWKLSKASMYRGVTIDKRSGQWIAQASKEGEHHYLGTYASEIEAARAYDLAAKKLWGGRAVLNF